MKFGLCGSAPEAWHFQNPRWPPKWPPKSKSHNNFGNSCARILILVSNSMFSMSMNLIMQLFLHLDMFMVMKIKIFDKITLLAKLRCCWNLWNNFVRTYDVGVLMYVLMVVESNSANLSTFNNNYDNINPGWPARQTSHSQKLKHDPLESYSLRSWTMKSMKTHWIKCIGASTCVYC